MSIEEMKELIDYLEYHNEKYNEGHPEISDEEWDNAYFKLKKAEEESGIIFANSPTQSIQYDIVSNLIKTKHNHPMLSLDKTKEINDINSFLGEEDYVAMLKMDGLTCSLTYENGKLIKAETRGDGVIGEDITHNIYTVKNIPITIPDKTSISIDGEIICTYEKFEKWNTEYKNPRNFASGSIRLLDPKECQKRCLSFVAWELIDNNYDFKYFSKKLAHLDSLGFDVVPFLVLHGNVQDWVISDLRRSAEKHSYPIDGLVFKFQDIEYGESLGKTAHHFNDAISYKFYDDLYETKLIDIIWSMGRTGQITPVALFETINIDGTEVNRASLSNLSILKKTLGERPFKGQTIMVTKRNQIIPKIEKAKDENGQWI